MIDLDEIVAKMRALGITKYIDGPVCVELGDPPLPPEPAVDESKERQRAEAQARAAALRKHQTLFQSTSMRPRFKWGNAK